MYASKYDINQAHIERACEAGYLSYSDGQYRLHLEPVF